MWGLGHKYTRARPIDTRSWDVPHCARAAVVCSVAKLWSLHLRAFCRRTAGSALRMQTADVLPLKLVSLPQSLTH